jgi:hypothetical protein
VCSLSMSCGVKQSDGTIRNYGNALSCGSASGYAICDGGNLVP